MLAFVSTSIERMPRWASREGKFHHHVTKLIIGGLFCLLLLSWTMFFHTSIPYLSSSYLPENPITNATLGFQKIYALTLSGREDRIQPLLDAANATNIAVTLLNAVRDEEIANADYPKGWSKQSHRIGEIGCLASHVRTWNLMLASNISTAFIMESDADWDLRIKDIMAHLATGIRTLIDWPFTAAHHIESPLVLPYGDTWDIVWIGHCGSNRDGNIRAYTWNDTTVPPEDREFIFDLGLSSEQHVPGTRSVYQFGRTTCSTAYAISHKGAEKLVNYFKETDMNLDLELSSSCSRRPDMTCLGVWPQVITAVNTESNIDHSGNGDQVSSSGDGGKKEGKHEEVKVTAGPAIQFSARVNAEKILNEQIDSDDWKGEWDTCWALRNGTWDMVKLNETAAREEEERKKEKEKGPKPPILEEVSG